ncbi:MAG: Xaa-Pro dipeptidase [Sinobacteraceae bacterium]|nr:Xaa-Pro dipeptidase [Nevskiaceae bacterium]
MHSPDTAALFAAHLHDISRRTATALAACGYEGLLLQAGEPALRFLDDQYEPLHLHPPFKAWVPLADAAGSLLYFEPGRRPRLIFHRQEDYWHKSAELPAESWLDAFDISIVGSRTAARAALPTSLARTAYIGQPFPELLAWGPAAINPQHLLHRLDFDRARKTAWEVACLREANAIGARGHRAAEAAFRAGGSEFDIHQAFLAACEQREQELPYNAIVALNEAAATLHYQQLQRRAPAELRSLLLDAGADCRGYGSDITRTWSFGDPDFGALIAAMDDLQRGLCATVHAGVDWRAMHLLAVERIATLLVEAEILRCTPQQAVEQGLATHFFPHGLGHLLGLQVHDVGGTQAGPEGGEIPRPAGHPALRLTRVLEPGFVVTMEPGIYFIDALLAPLRQGPQGSQVNWQRVAALQPFGGIRIEDDLVVTTAGCENLTRDAFAALSRP